MSHHHQEVVLKGLSVSSGIGIGKAYQITSLKEHAPRGMISPDLDCEIRRYQNAVDASIHDLEDLQNQLKKENALEGIKVFESHMQLLQDPMMTTDIIQEIKRTKKNSLAVLHRTLLDYQNQFASIKDPFFQERFLDLQDVVDRVKNHLKRKVHLTFSHLPTGSVLFAEDLTPSEVAALKLGTIVGLVTKRGGMNSHAAIIAKSKGIPYVAHLDFKDHKMGPESLVIIDGRKGEVTLHPEEETLKRFNQAKKHFLDFQIKLKDGETLSPNTEDGCEVRLYLNVNHPRELETENVGGWAGVGLFRTEFLLDEKLPTEEEQFEIYKNLLLKFPDKPCAFRVFDVGGEKATLSPDHMNEQNPSLGMRAIRFLLKESHVLKIQLRALLRASLYGDLRILLPMISTIDELRESRKRVEEIKDELHKEGVVTKESIPVGCMVEVPSAALIADHLANESDFLSFGTNDLVQYTLAVDRSNHLVTGIYTPFHPSVIRMLKHVVREAKKKQIPLSICGEIASDPRYIPILLGLGIRELSLSHSSYGMIKHVIRKTNLKQCQTIAKKALLMSSSSEIEFLLNAHYEQLIPTPH